MTYQRAIIPFLNRSDKDIIKMQNVFGGLCSVFFVFVFKVCITIKVFEIKSELSRIKAFEKKNDLKSYVTYLHYSFLVIALSLRNVSLSSKPFVTLPNVL